MNSPFATLNYYVNIGTELRYKLITFFAIVVGFC